MADPATFVFVTEAEVPPGDAWFGARERTAAVRHRTAKRRAEWRAGRWAAKTAVARRLGLEPAEVEVAAGEDGAPEPSLGGRRLPVNVSISHRAGSAIAVATPGDVAPGCDLELVEPRPAGFAADWFTPREQAAVDAAPPGERDLLVTVFWSARESVLKVLREGLRADTRSVELSVRDGVFDAECKGRRFKGWWKRDGRFVITAAAEERLQ